MDFRFATYGDIIINIDSTYKTNYENYVLYIFLVQDQGLHGLPIAGCFMRQETAANMEFMYNELSEIINADMVRVLMIDKDLQNVDLMPK